jgi:perosamine synthetase
MRTATQDKLTDLILERLEGMMPARRPVALHEPSFGTDAWGLVKDCLDSGWVSSAGAYVDRFEQGLADYTGIANAVATVNGTAALHTCLLLAGVRPGDEVLLPALTFVGTANPVAAMGAIPHFVDSAGDTLGVSPRALSAHLAEIAEWRGGICINRHTGRRIRALVVVHVLGHLADMPALREIADRYRLKLIEDAAEALGSFRDDRHAGHWGDSAALSFNGNKVITTGGGGAVMTNEAELARQARHLTTTAKLPHPWALEHDQVAFNYRLPNLNAALGVAQLGQLPGLLAAKRELARTYRQAFAGLGAVQLFAEPAGCRANHWLNLLLLPDAGQRDALLEAALARGLLLRPLWTPLHRLPMYTEVPRATLPVAESLFARSVCLPSSAALISDGETPQ